MSASSYNAASDGVQSPRSGIPLFHRLSVCMGALYREMGYHRAEMRMHELTDGMLFELGIHRCEIGAVVRNGQNRGR